MSSIHKAARSLSIWLSCSMALPGLFGCEYYRAETKLFDNGTVERAIYQPRDETPQEVQDAKHWSAITFAREIEHDEWDSPITELPLVSDPKDKSYFAAWGRFKSVASIPNHLVTSSPDQREQGKLVRQGHRIDYVFVVEHQWSETLTDIVTLDGMHLARKELADLGIRMLRDIFEEALGDKYDWTAMEKWARTEGTEWFFEITDVYYDAAVRRKRQFMTFDENLHAGIAKVSSRHGLQLRDAHGKLLASGKMGDYFNSTVKDFARRKFQALVHDKNDKPIDSNDIDQIFEWLYLISGGGFDVNNRFTKAKERVFEKKWRGEEPVEQRIAALFARVFGVYWRGGLRVFDFTLEVPGTIVETDGILLGDNKVKWNFLAFQAYPVGYSMTCRSLSPQLDIQKKVLGAQPLKNRKTMVRYVSLVKQQKDILPILKECKTQASAQPLLRYHQKVLEDSGIGTGKPVDVDKAKELRRVRRFLKLLNLPH